MVGASWDLEVEGHRRGEGTDLVAPAELWPNGNRTRHVSTPSPGHPLKLCLHVREVLKRVIVPYGLPLGMVVD